MEGQLDKVDLFDSRQFFIAVKRLADSIVYGTDRSPFLGAGVEFVQSRQYQPGEPVRAIDWRVTARTGKHYVKEYETPRSLPCYLLLDRSASMMVQSSRKSKYALALHIAGGLALACLERVSPVGVVGAGSGGFRVRPSLSKHQIFEWLHRLKRFSYDETTALADRIAELNTNTPNRALVFVLSDGDTIPPTGMPTMPASVRDVVVVGVGDSKSGSFIDGHQSRQDVSTLRQLAVRLKGHYHNGNKKHLPSDLVNQIGQVQGHSRMEQLTRREYAILAAVLGGFIYAFLPLLLHWTGTNWKPGVTRRKTRRHSGELSCEH